MTIIEKLSESCNVKPIDIIIVGRSGYWTIVEYTLGGVKCRATLATQ